MGLAATWAGIVGPVVFAVGVVTASLTVPGYSRVGQAISELGVPGTNSFWIQNTNFVVFGVLTVLFSLALRGLPAGTAIATLVLVAGLATAGSGVAHCAPGCPFPGEDPGVTTGDAVHMLLGALVFLPCIAAPLVAGLAVRRRPQLVGYAVYSLVTGVATFIAFVVFAFFAEDIGVDGLSERVMLALPFTWFAVTAVLVLRGRLPAARA
ncbi:MAG TPA: DUF998 domain-containing protein [Nocardioidaceae bacterium]|nr:DUF998 domain-containing protein [Nocardioidaceae bacterium]